jgi:pantoate kinase
MAEAATAFVPGHVTGLFTVDRREDPAKTGSRGAGFTLADGVTVTIRPAESTSVRIEGTETDVESVRRVLDALDRTARVDVEADLPVGRGFGLSGGMALGTALAANEAFELSRGENELIRHAHVADALAGTGLGDVVAQARGGIVLRLQPGAPPHGRLDAIPGDGRVEFLAMGERSTPEILADRPETITKAGEEALEWLRAEPTRDRFSAAASQFTEAVELATPRLRSVIESVEATGGTASVAMLGETVYAFGTDLSDAGYDPAVSRVDPCGAELRE